MIVLCIYVLFLLINAVTADQRFKYTENDFIAMGKQGKVYKGRDVETGTFVAVKKFKAGFNKMFLPTEVKIIEILPGNQDGVIEIIALFRIGRDPHIVFPLYERDLLDYVSKKRALTDSEILEMSERMLAGLESIHSLGIVHGDVKPENFLMNGDVKSIVLSDFGSAVLTDEGKAVFGYTPFYASPDVINDVPASPSGDMWAFAASVYQIVSMDRISTDQLSFPPDEAVLRKLEGSVMMKKLLSLLNACFSEDPLERPTATEAHSSVKNLLSEFSWHHDTSTQ